MLHPFCHRAHSKFCALKKTDWPKLLLVDRFKFFDFRHFKCSESECGLITSGKPVRTDGVVWNLTHHFRVDRRLWGWPVPPAAAPQISSHWHGPRRHHDRLGKARAAAVPGQARRHSGWQRRAADSEPVSDTQAGRSCRADSDYAPRVRARPGAP